MLKKLVVTTAVTALTIGAAAAQGTTKTPRPRPGSAPAATPSTPPPAARSTAMSKPASSASTAKFINSQPSDQHLASKLNGTDVLGTDNQKIGDVSDILFDKDGKIRAYVASAGGFLGLGSKNVALEPSAFQVVAGDKSKNAPDKLKISMTKDELTQAANFEPYKAASSTTGMGSSRPAPGG